MKRKVRSKETKKLVYGPLATRPLNRKLKCTWHTRLIIQNTPSGTRYEFLPGETKEVKQEDYKFLLAKKRKAGSGCCGDAGTSINYFEEV